jgi:hypothetical protein
MPAPLSRTRPHSRLRLETLDARDTPAVFHVTPFAADGAAGSLRVAVTASSQLAEHSDIFLATGTYHLTLGAIQVADTDVWIGPEPEAIPTVDQDTAGASVFVVDGGTVTLRGLTITGGTATDSGGGVNILAGDVTVLECTLFGNTAGDRGGGISNAGNLVVQDSVITNNTAGVHGGGISNRLGTPNLSILGCTISGNSAQGGGGGVNAENNFGPTIIVRDSSIFGNTAVVAGGGFGVGQPILIERSAIVFNTVTGGPGGGVNNGMALTIRNSTVTGNTASAEGGGVYSHGLNASVVMTSCTVTDNAASIGGGIFETQTQGTSITNSVAAGNSAANGPDIFSQSSISSAFSLIGDAAGYVESSGVGNLLAGTNPMLGPFQNYGGRTGTRLPVAGSPLIDRGSNVLVPADLTTDQRGSPFVRVYGTAVDIGAAEVQAIVVTPGGGGGGFVTYVEDAAPVVIDPGLTITSPSNVVEAVVRITNVVPGEDQLTLTPPTGTTATYDAQSGTLTITGNATATEYQAALRTLTFENESQSPFETPRVVILSVDDGSNVTPASVSYSVLVVARNDAPGSLDDGELYPILQGSASPPGRRLVGIFAGLLDDPDAGAMLAGVAIVANPADPTTDGSWQYSTDNGATWFAMGTVADGPTALALSAQARVRFLPVASFSGRPPALTVRALDDTFTGLFTAGGSRQTVDTGVSGGTTPIAGTTNTIGTEVFPTGTSGNTPPTLAGAPVSANLNEGQVLAFTASATDPDNGQQLTFSLGGAPAGASIDPDTGAFSWTPTEAQGPDTFVFEVRVSDGMATTSRTVTAIVREVNSVPVLEAIPNPLPTVRGRAVTFTATATDTDVMNGLSNTLTYSLVNGPVGASIDPDTGEFSWVPGGSVDAHTYPVVVRVADDGVPSAGATATVSIAVADATLTNDGNLLIGGTDGNDSMTVKLTKDKLGLVVTLNGDILGTHPVAAITGRVAAYGLGGNDKVAVNAKVTVGADLYGGSGNDSLTGGAGSDILVGGTGKDTLSGGSGTNVLTGGAGADKLTGGTGDDLLVGGSTAFDVDPTGLTAIRAKWASGTPYADRVNNLKVGGGLNGTVVLGPATVTDDAKDKLTGGKGLDWFVVGLGDTLDLKAGEQKLVL